MILQVMNNNEYMYTVVYFLLVELEKSVICNFAIVIFYAFAMSVVRSIGDPCQYTLVHNPLRSLVTISTSNSSAVQSPWIVLSLSYSLPSLHIKEISSFFN
jgi:hypothetical protein